MDHNKKWVDVVAKLNEMTQSGKLEWRRLRPPEISASDNYIDMIYTAPYKDRYISLYDKKVEDVEDYSQYGETFFWVRKIVLAISDAEGYPIWEFPHVHGIEDLFNSVSYQVADVKGFLDDLMDDQ